MTGWRASQFAVEAIGHPRGGAGGCDFVCGCYPGDMMFQVTYDDHPNYYSGGWYLGNGAPLAGPTWPFQMPLGFTKATGIGQLSASWFRPFWTPGDPYLPGLDGYLRSVYDLPYLPGDPDFIGWPAAPGGPLATMNPPLDIKTVGADAPLVGGEFGIRATLAGGGAEGLAFIGADASQRPGEADVTQWPMHEGDCWTMSCWVKGSRAAIGTDFSIRMGLASPGGSDQTVAGAVLDGTWQFVTGDFTVGPSIDGTYAIAYYLAGDLNIENHFADELPYDPGFEQPHILNNYAAPPGGEFVVACLHIYPCGTEPTVPPNFPGPRGLHVETQPHLLPYREPHPTR